MRGKADSNNWANDSVFIQFTGSQTSSSGAAAWRIGTTSAAEVNLEDCNGCGVSGWGWQDNGYGNNVAGQPIYFASTGWQTVRVQVREDGLSIDQIVLSHTVFLNTSPGTLKNDTTILAEADGSGAATAAAATATAAGNAGDSALGRRGARQGRMAGGTRHVCRRRLEALESERESAPRSRRPRPRRLPTSR